MCHNSETSLSSYFEKWRSKVILILEDEDYPENEKIFLHQILDYCDCKQIEFSLEDLMIETKRRYALFKKHILSDFFSESVTRDFLYFTDLYSEAKDFGKHRAAEDFRQWLETSSQEVTRTLICHRIGVEIKSLIEGPTLQYCDGNVPEKFIKEKMQLMELLEIPHSAQNDERFAFLCELFPSNFLKINETGLAKYLIFEYRDEYTFCQSVNRLVYLGEYLYRMISHIGGLFEEQPEEERPFTIEDMPEDCRDLILKKDMLGKIHTVLNKYFVGNKSIKRADWDVVVFTLQRLGYLEMRMTRAKMATILSALCPSLGEPIKLERSMSRYPVSTFDYKNKYDKLTPDNLLRKDSERMENLLKKGLEELE